MREGSMDILWENRSDRIATPKYQLLFLPYQNSRNGAQQPHLVVGDGALNEYLASLNSDAKDATEWVEKVKSQGSVTIPNVMMPGEHLASYGY